MARGYSGVCVSACVKFLTLHHQSVATTVNGTRPIGAICLPLKTLNVKPQLKTRSAAGEHPALVTFLVAATITGQPAPVITIPLGPAHRVKLNPHRLQRARERGAG